MNKHLKALIVALGIALASAGVAYADDGGGGDNSMSQWCGESYAAFQRNLVGDFYSTPAEVASSSEPAPLPDTQLAVAPIGAWGIGHVFRDDTAA